MKRKRKKPSVRFFVVSTEVYNHRGEMIAKRGTYIPANLPPQPDEMWWRANIRRRPL